MEIKENNILKLKIYFLNEDEDKKKTFISLENHEQIPWF